MTAFVLPLAGGAIIGLACALLWLLTGRIAGISGIAGSLVTSSPTARSWKLVFLLGLGAGGVLVRASFPEAFGASPASYAGLLTAGFLVGVGTNLASGCTSGHGVCGVSRLSARSIGATLTFVSVGALTVYLVRQLGGGAS